MDQIPRLIASTLPGYLDPSTAIAATRCGALGVLDLEYVSDVDSALSALAALGRFAKGPCGVKLDLSNTGFAAGVLQELPGEIGTVVLARPCVQLLQEQIRALQSIGRIVLVEAIDAATVSVAADAGVAGIIVKGNEAGGRVGEETAFVLFQRCVARTAAPLWVQGGIGPAAAAACIAGGAAGVVLDWQLALTRESPLPDVVRDRLASLDGSETATIGGGRLGDTYRVYNRPGSAAVRAIRAEAQRLLTSDDQIDLRKDWREAVRSSVGGASLEALVLMSQDAALAAGLAGPHRTVGGVLGAIDEAVPIHIRAAQDARPLNEFSALATSHATRYPILQGPMTRVSDVPAFCEAVADGGGLPFLALALLRAPRVEALLGETKARMGQRPWGAGILGFVPLELRQEQIEVVRKYRPPFAIIAGGRPDQAAQLEREGTVTYLHVPSPGLLELFLESGARRFIFEGRECGGHVGPRSSFVLWQLMINLLSARIDAGEVRGTDCQVVLAGGIHDARSAAMVAVMAGTLASRGVKIGVLMGTAYLFTAETVSCGAITDGFQREALRCDRTVLLETGAGHAIRCFDTPFVATFEREKAALLASNRPPEEVRATLEELNLGRLRIASKGVKRHPGFGTDPDAPRYVEVRAAEQHADGMYMSGQIAALRNGVTTIAQLHREVAIGGTALLQSIEMGETVEQASARPSDIAIVGMSTLLPKAPTLQRYWENILKKVDAIEEVPRGRWDPADYFDPDRTKKDRVYSIWGGFLDDVPFDPVAYGMPPNSLRSIEPGQLLALEATRAALADAGYGDRPFDRERTSVILGAGGGVAEHGQRYGFRASLPLYFGEQADSIVEQLGDALPEWSEDSFAGILTNVAAGRVANRFDLGGSNFTVDAACASSLAAVHLGVRELESGASSMVVVGGVDTIQNPFAYLAFSKTQALSPGGRCRTFDDSADGIAISEGLAVLVLKRLEDAERDGDRIYAVIKGVGSSSDGRDKGLTAPRPEGQIRALERAYAKAGISPATVGLIEAHGTGTVAGDRAEVTALSQFFARVGAERQNCAIGSVKSMIGHTKCTAGVVGLVKVALALHYKILPPTLGVERPNSRANFPETPFYVNSETRPWIGRADGTPRRAGVSAFGFGGTNFHAVVEEYTGAFMPAEDAPLRTWPGELFTWSAADRRGLLEAIAPVEQALSAGTIPSLADLALTVCSSLEGRKGEADCRLAIVAHSAGDLGKKLGSARSLLADPSRSRVIDPSGVFFSERPLTREGRLAFLFAGQGSQYPDMGRDLALHFSEARATYEQVDACLADRYDRPLSARIFPPPSFTAEEARVGREALKDTHVAQPALGAMAMATCRVLGALGLAPDMVAGHSYGEFVALWAAGAFDDDTLFRLSEARGRFMRDGSASEPGTMAAVEADATAVLAALEGLDGVTCANVNAPRQTVISGARPAIEQAIARLTTRGIPARPLPVACAFHSPLVAAARDQLAEALAETAFRRPSVPVYSNTTAAVYPDDPGQMAALLGEHLVQPVEFVRQVEAMYRDGARIFVEIGPKAVLTGLVGQILAGRPHLAVATDREGRNGLHQLQLALACLWAEGVPVTPGRLFAGRGLRRLNLDMLERAEAEHSPTTWLVNGWRAVPAREADQPLHRPRVKLGDAFTPGGTAAGSGGAGEEKEKAASMGDQVNMSSPLPHSGGGSTSATPIGGLAQPPLDLPPANGHAGPLPNGPLAPAASAAGGPTRVPADAVAVVTQFQQVMSRFLDTQRAVMLAYLGGTAAGAPQSELTLEAAPSISYSVSTATALISPTPGEPSGGALVPTTAAVPASPAPAVPETAAALAVPAQSGTLVVPATPIITRESVTALVVALVAERTGYPAEMLDLDVDMEADLGIDSIKRVEILGALRRQVGDQSEQSEAAMEELFARKTLRGIIDWMLEHAAVGSPSPAARVAAATVPAGAAATRAAGEEAICRSALKVVEAPLTGQPAAIAEDGVVLITDDGCGIATALAQGLRESGAKVALVQAASTTATVEIAPGTYACRLDSVDALRELAGVIRARQGAVAGVVHLLPARPAPALDSMDLGRWRQRLAEDVESLFGLAQAFGGDLHGAAQHGGAALLAATAMGGAFGADDSADTFVGNGAVAGLTKTLALEWPDVRVRAIDLDPSAGADALARCLLRELYAGDTEVEVGYPAGRRNTIRIEPAPLAPTESGLAIDSSWVILVTGGARGITAEAALELARRYRPTLLLAGRSPQPPPEEDPETASLGTDQELKAAIIARLQREGRAPRPAEVEQEHRRLLREREMRVTLQRLEAAGVRVRYLQADMREEAAVRRLLDGIYEQFGRLDGVVHGAGIIEDKLIEQKDQASFRRVFGTKADSGFLLARLLRFDTLRFLVFFSSVSGRFGNRGQGDYAAGNEVLNKLARHLNQQHLTRVVAINWGPWAAGGMVSPDVERQFAERGVLLIPRELGARMFDDELRLGPKSDAEVVVAGGSGLGRRHTG